MRILITGGCGFLGSNLASEALTRGDRVVVFDNLYRSGSALNLDWLKSLGAIEFVHGDIRNPNDVVRVVKDLGPQAVFHLAGQVAMTTSVANPRMDFEINALGTNNLLEAVRLYAPLASIIYSSSNKVYGDLTQFRYTESRTRYVCEDRPNGFDELTPLDFRSPYGCSKGCADQYMLDYARFFGLKTVVFRHSSMYGGRQFATYDQGWIGWFCSKALEVEIRRANAPFTISGSGKQVRDMLHASDVVDLYFTALERIESIAGHAFNIGGGIGNSLSLLELFSMLEDSRRISLRYKKLPPRESDQLVFVADISKAHKLIGWEPRVPASEGIERTLEWLSRTRSAVE
jgi:CDP-paratose 2-epimerase